MNSNPPVFTHPTSIRLMLGSPSDCPYLPDKKAQYAVVGEEDKQKLGYSLFLENGFRRDGSFIFKPMCADCNACESLKIDSENFQARRRHKRNLQANRDLTISTEPLANIGLYHQLFKDYQIWRHPEQSDDLNEGSLEHFKDDVIDRSLLVAKLDGETIAVTIIDNTDIGLSAVYSFYQPQLSERGLGTYMVLQLIEMAKQEDLPWVYLGYYVADCKKLSYKKLFQPIQSFDSTDSTWKDLESF